MVTSPPATTPAGSEAPARRRPSGRQDVALATLAVLAALGAAVALRPDHGRKLHSWREGKGPLGGGSSTMVGLAVDLDAPFTYGAAGVENVTDDTAVLEAVRVRPPLPDGIEVVGTGATGPNRNVPTVNNSRKWPADSIKDALHPLAGTEVPPRATKAGRAGIDLVFGLKVTKPGYWGFAQVDLDYRVGNKEYTVRLDHGVYVCAPMASYPNGCDDDDRFMKSLQRQVGIKVPE